MAGTSTIIPTRPYTTDGDARQQLHRRADHRRQTGRGRFGQKDGGHQTHRHPQQQRSRRAVDRGEDEGQDAELRAGGGVSRRPHLAEEEFGQSDLPDGRQAGDHPDTR